MNILILGGTSEASALASLLAERSIPAIYSYAGRVSTPKPQPLPTRIGGFGGVDGLIAYLQQAGITHLIDATHPFAEQMSRHALNAAAQCNVPLMVFTRPAWQPQPGDNWTHVASIDEAVNQLDGRPERVMLAIGRQHLEAFAAKPQHHYLLRLVDHPEQPIPLPHQTITVERGPFTTEGDLALLKDHAVDRLVCKNAGGNGAVSKLTAARALGLPVVMIERPTLPSRREYHALDDVLAWLFESTERGV
ncbi:cobalt-precorrin-6A reductase [Halomonas llamarensis]|uniref:Cobalt-precorrin-6A reductase n=1 Tax=Halomonas llamarensis TaxID=2945104 RepID=A0ABT0SU47_9GAMM|nr:cobalt-precorrin-6A reductase [Halomonas llamarensis]MCL7931362.1 cobalt-precorrin-6A reductase [Halomonas llamarensis]